MVQNVARKCELGMLASYFVSHSMHTSTQAVSTDEHLAMGGCSDGRGIGYEGHRLPSGVAFVTTKRYMSKRPIRSVTVYLYRLDYERKTKCEINYIAYQ